MIKDANLQQSSMRPSLRIIDANLNRAREALRVLEDAARFAANDGESAGKLKELRHGLMQVPNTIGEQRLLAARDVENDVGLDLRTEREQQRTDADAVIGAALGRLTESLRSICEYAKIISPEAASLAERLRYQAYALEPLMRLRTPLRERFRQARLYVIISQQFCRDDWRHAAEAALRGGAGALQLREKTLSDRELLERAALLRDLTRRHNALLCINDRPDIAALVDADAVHVGQDDLCVSDARRICGGWMLIGVSTHTREQFEAALAQQPDYIAVGPMFPTATKPQEHIAGPHTLAALRPFTRLPLVAIGGITTGNAGQVRESGADVLCVCAAVVGAPDPERSAAGLRAILAN